MAELLVVVAIIAVLVAIAIPLFAAQADSARAATCLANRRALFAEVRITAMSDAEDEATVFTELMAEPDNPYTCPSGGTWRYEGGTILCNAPGHERIGGGEDEDLDFNNPTPGTMSALLSAIDTVLSENFPQQGPNSERVIQLQNLNGATDLINAALGEQVFGEGHSNMLVAIPEWSKDSKKNPNPIQGVVYQSKASGSKGYYLYYGSDVYTFSDYGKLKDALASDDSASTSNILNSFIDKNSDFTKV